MALGNKKPAGKTSKPKRDNSGKRYVASVWKNEGKNGEYLSLAVDNLDPDSEHNKGTLLWYDKDTEKYYKVKSMNIFEAEKGPEALLNKLVLDLNNEYHVEEVEAE